jgi:prepilin-type N-terminal cleavage/methylation domain-containing protein
MLLIGSKMRRSVFSLLELRPQRHKASIRQAGFTLIEVMVAASILALGAVLIHEAFFLLLDSYNYCMNRLNLISWVNQKLWQAQSDLSAFGMIQQTPSQGSFISRSKTFNWNISYQLIDQALDLSDLYKIDLIVSWQEGKRNVDISRTAYAIFRKQE